MKFFWKIVLVAFLLATLAYTADKPSSIRVNYVVTFPLIIMREKGYLDEAFKAKGIKVESPEITSGANQTQAMAAREIDIASALGGTSAILAKGNGVDLKVIAAYSGATRKLIF